MEKKPELSVEKKKPFCPEKSVSLKEVEREVEKKSERQRRSIRIK